MDSKKPSNMETAAAAMFSGWSPSAAQWAFTAPVAADGKPQPTDEELAAQANRKEAELPAIDDPRRSEKATATLETAAAAMFSGWSPSAAQVAFRSNESETARED